MAKLAAGLTAKIHKGCLASNFPAVPIPGQAGPGDLQNKYIIIHKHTVSPFTSVISLTLTVPHESDGLTLGTEALSLTQPSPSAGSRELGLNIPHSHPPPQPPSHSKPCLLTPTPRNIF